MVHLPHPAPLLLAILPALLVLALSGAAPAADEPWLRLPAGEGPGRGRNIVLIAGDQEYRSEEAMPQLGRILSRRHGFDCTVLFCVDPTDGTVNPTVNNIPGLEHLAKADLVILFTRMLDLPDPQMKSILDYVESGRPLIGIRTSTHAFQLTQGSYRRYSWRSAEPGFEGGFGRLVLGETWIAHHGEHGKQGTRGIPAPGQERHPILRGIRPGSIFGPTDVYAVRLPLPGDSLPVVLGEVTETLEPDSPGIPGPKNHPMMPVAWTRTYRGASGRAGRVFTATLGASQDLAYEGTRRMLVNAAYWALGMEDRLAAEPDVRLVGEYRPTPFRFRKSEEWKPGRKPAEH